MFLTRRQTAVTPSTANTLIKQKKRNMQKNLDTEHRIEENHTPSPLLHTARYFKGKQKLVRPELRLPLFQTNSWVSSNTGLRRPCPLPRTDSYVDLCTRGGRKAGRQATGVRHTEHAHVNTRAPPLLSVVETVGCTRIAWVNAPFF